MEHPGLASPGLGEVVTGVPRQRDSAGAEVPLVRKRRFREARRRAKEPRALSPAASLPLLLAPGHSWHTGFFPRTPRTPGEFLAPAVLRRLGYTSVKSGVELWCVYVQACLPHHPSSILKDRAQHMAVIQLIV